MVQSNRQPLVAAARKTADGAVVAVIHRAVVLLNIRHQVVHHVFAERVVTELQGWERIFCTFFWWKKLGRVAVWQHDNHLLGVSRGYQVVEDIVHPTHFVVHLLRVGRAADQVEYGIVLVSLAHVVGRKVNQRVVRALKALGIIMDIFHCSMGNRFDVVSQCSVG